MTMTLNQIIEEEKDFAFAKYGRYHNAHELYGVLMEEVEEFWDHVKGNTADTPYALYELLQVAAVAIRYVEENEESIDEIRKAQKVRHAR